MVIAMGEENARIFDNIVGSFFYCLLHVWDVAVISVVVVSRVFLKLYAIISRAK